jgi:hypothetical protein
MKKLFAGAAVTASALAMALSPAAMASGGKLFGGGATGGGGGGGTTTTTTTTGGGGGGGGGGGINSGGVNSGSGTDAPVVPCAALSNVSAPVGYYSTWAAVWNNYAVRSCATGSESVNVSVTNTNVATGQVDYSVTVPYTLTAGQNASSVLDNDFAPFSTDYDVKVQVTDNSGNVLATQSLAATTPPQR